jgi:hypothetical protein
VKYLGFALLGVAMAAPATAQSVQFSAVAESEVGYATNPFLSAGVTKGTVFASASIAPRLFYETARSTTTLDGRYSREAYINNFGHTDAGTVELVRTDQISQYLGSTLTASYETSNRATIDDPNRIVTDPLNIGRRTRTVMGSYGLQWQASARDQVSYGAQVSHLSYGSSQTAGLAGVPSNYTQYGVNAAYNHSVDARTAVGAQVTLSSVRSQFYPDSRTVQPSLTAKRQLTAVWAIDGHVGVVFSRIEGPFPKSTTSLGIGVNLCGEYPRTHVCLKFNRDTQPSGFGPLRTTSSIDGALTHQLDEHSRISVNAEFVRDSSGSFSVVGNQLLRMTKLFQGSADYDRDVTRRVSAGFGGQYRWRSLSGYPDARSYTGTIHVKAKLGRI